MTSISHQKENCGIVEDSFLACNNGHHTNVRISCKHNPVNEDTMLRLVRNLYVQWVIICYNTINPHESGDDHPQYGYIIPQKSPLHTRKQPVTLRQNSVPKSLNWFEGNVTGKPYISWKKLWFPVDVPANPLTKRIWPRWTLGLQFWTHLQDSLHISWRPWPGLANIMVITVSGRNGRVLPPNTSYKWDYNGLYNP